MMKRLLNIFLFATISMLAYSQSLPHSYFCDFENEEENKEWQLNTPSNSEITYPNKWYIGTAESYEGEKSLYISANGGKSSSFVGAEQMMIAWRDLTLEAGTYDFCINWKNMGSQQDYVFLTWMDENDCNSIDFTCTNNSNLRPWMTNGQIKFEDVDTLYDCSAWRHSVGKIVSDGKKHRLLVVWRTHATSASRNPAACIDNIYIARNNCGRPTDLKVDVSGQTATLSWNSTAEKFNLKYRNIRENEAKIINNIGSNKHTMLLPYGVYEVYLQVICQGDTSIWYAMPLLLVFDSKCFNYLNLNDNNCSYSDSTNVDYKRNVFTKGKLDFGFTAPYSYHTIHYLPGEYDARTYNSKDADGNAVAPLATIPQGEVASVRINGWRGRPAALTEDGKADQTARVARVEYVFTVDNEEASALMLKYAAVLQVPDHDEYEQPRFTLQIEDAATGNILSTCTDVDFAATNASAKKNGWYFTKADGLDVIWKDWTTVGLNLQEYDGKQVKIVLTAYGCYASAHYGYAYFTVNCTNGNIQGINCGDTPTTEFIAPEGFNYHWYLVDDPQRALPNNDKRNFPVAYDDTAKYEVLCSYKTDPNCGFTLSACAVPRYPIAQAEWVDNPKDCKHYVSMKNLSHIRTKNIKTNVYTDTDVHPDAVMWTSIDGAFNQTTEWEPIFEFPRQGGKYNIQLEAIVGMCDSILNITIELPELNDTIVTDTVQVCEGTLFNYNGKILPHDTIITTYGKRTTGCDSTYNFMLRYVKQIVNNLSVTITDEETYQFGSQTLSESGTYSEHFTSIAGCDSLVNLTLNVVPKLRLTVTPSSPCSDEQIVLFDYSVSTGTPTQCTISFSDTAKQYGFKDTLCILTADQKQISLPLPKDIPGWWHAKFLFTSKENGDVEADVDFMVRYASSLLAQRWNDVIGIKKEAEQMSTGATFTSYQWYKNGQPLDKQTEPYFYSDIDLNPQDNYSVEIWRAGEPKGVLSCELTPVKINLSDISVTPTSVKSGDKIKVRLQGTARMELYSMMGVKQLSWTIPQGGDDVQITAPPGTYLIRIETNNGDYKSLVIQVR